MLSTKQEFEELVASIEATDGYRKPLAWGIGRITRGQVNKEKVLSVAFPFINWNCNFGSFAVIYNTLGVSEWIAHSLTLNEMSIRLTSGNVQAALQNLTPFIEEAVGDAHKNIQVLQTLDLMVQLPNGHDMGTECAIADAVEYRLIAIFEDDVVMSPEVAYLKLMALSQGLVPLRSLNLNGLFGVLTNVAWVGNIPVELEYLRKNEIQLKLTGDWPKIDYVDKLPRYLDHIIPADNTRILDTSKVRFGAQLAAGTTVMPGASYINFNSGTEGPSMVEGRISSSAKVGAGSDVGGGASILGILSGGNSDPITIGENTLLGANSVCGISLGDGCILDAGCTILAGTRVTILKTEFEKIQEINQGEINVIGHPDDLLSYILTGKMLSGLNGVHIRQHSESGKIIAFRSVREIKLNPDLHGGKSFVYYDGNTAVNCIVTDEGIAVGDEITVPTMRLGDLPNYPNT